MARRFFLICAGFLCLSISYHLGARVAIGQGAVVVDGAHIDSPGGPIQTAFVTCAIGRVFYANGSPVAVPIPGGARVIATDGTASSEWPYAVLLENGDFYYGSGTVWALQGNVLGDATSPTRVSWGSLKARYR